MAPKKNSVQRPSIQTKFILDAMAAATRTDEDRARKEDERWETLMQNIDLLFTCVAAVDTTQQLTLAQVDLNSRAIDQVTRVQHLLLKQVDEGVR